MSNRGHFASKFGVLMATVGSAVGLGNIWRFPYQVGNGGGGAFLLVYILAVVLIGIPAILAEFIVGRESHANVVGAFQKIRPGSNWKWVGYLGILTGFVIDCYYCVVTGWTLYYLYASLKTGFLGQTPEAYSQMFSTFSSSVWPPIICLIVIIIVTGLIVSNEIKEGIERASKIMMPILFILLIVLSVNSLLLPGATEGMRYLFIPDFTKLDLSTILSAVGQAFFSMSLGMGCLITYSSYFKEDVNLPRTATQIASIDLLVALLSGVIIFPAVFSFNLEPSQGAGLVFIVLPNVFSQIQFGMIWSILFYILLFIAALTSFLSISEVVVAYITESFNISRKWATVIACSIFAFVGSVCSLSFGPLSDYQLGSMNLFDVMDFSATNLMLPAGGLLTSIFVGWIIDKKIILRQLNLDTTNRQHIIILKVFTFFLKYIIPATIFVIMITGLL